MKTKMRKRMRKHHEMSCSGLAPLTLPLKLRDFRNHPPTFCSHSQWVVCMTNCPRKREVCGWLLGDFHNVLPVFHSCLQHERKMGGGLRKSHPPFIHTYSVNKTWVGSCENPHCPLLPLLCLCLCCTVSLLVHYHRPYSHIMADIVSCSSCCILCLAFKFLSISECMKMCLCMLSQTESFVVKCGVNHVITRVVLSILLISHVVYRVWCIITL